MGSTLRRPLTAHALRYEMGRELADQLQGALELSVRPAAAALVGLMLRDERCAAIRVVVQDPATDAVLAQSDEIPVKLGI